MNKTLENRVNRLMEHMGDLGDAMERTQARVRIMSDDELNTAIREVMLENGYDPSLPPDEALAKYVEKLEADATPEDQETITQLVELIKAQAETFSRIFPKTESAAAS